MKSAVLLPIAGAATVAGSLVGGTLALLEGPVYRAATTMLVEVHGAPAAVPTVAALATSDSVVENVSSEIHVSAGRLRHHLRVGVVSGTALIRIEYDDRDGVKAIQTVQQEATVLESIVAARLGGSTRVSVADPPRAFRLGRPVAGWTLSGGALGLAFALAGSLLLKVRERPPASETSAKQPPRRATPPAAVPVAVPAASPPAAASVAAAAPPPARPPVAPAPAGRVAELRALVAARAKDFSADQVAEWDGYLAALSDREIDGRLPPNLEGLARDVFAPLLDRP